jgi:hypothetical protein
MAAMERQAQSVENVQIGHGLDSAISDLKKPLFDCE